MLSKENEIKVFILYLMNDIMDDTDCGQAYGDIYNLAEDCGFIGYFDFSAVFSKLLQENNIQETDGIYFITERGKAIAENLAHLIPTALKNKCAVSAARMLELKKLGSDYYSGIEPENGGYRFICGIKNKNSELMNISLFIKDKDAADKMQRIFNERPGYIYRGILGMMTGDVDFILQS